MRREQQVHNRQWHMRDHLETTDALSPCGMSYADTYRNESSMMFIQQNLSFISKIAYSNTRNSLMTWTRTCVNMTLHLLFNFSVTALAYTTRRMLWDITWSDFQELYIGFLGKYVCCGDQFKFIFSCRDVQMIRKEEHEREWLENGWEPTQSLVIDTFVS